MRYCIVDNYELYHHGIKGQRWGVRRYQNEDGSLTSAGKARYEIDESGNMSKEGKKALKEDKREQYKEHAKKVTDAANEYSSRQSKGKSFAKWALVGGSSGHRTYDMARASGDGRVKAYLKGLFDINYNQIISGAVGAAASSIATVTSNKNSIASKTAGSAAYYLTDKLLTKNAEKNGKITSLQQRHLVKRSERNDN